MKKILLTLIACFLISNPCFAKDTVEVWETGTVAEAQEALKTTDINTVYKDEYNETPLLLAIDYHNIPVIKYLITAGADVNKPGGILNDTPFIEAAILGDFEIMKMMYEAGADPQIKNDYDENALHKYFYLNHCEPEMVQFLLDIGTDVNAKNRDFQASPLHGASRACNTDVIQILVNAGADLNALTKFDATPFAYALRSNSHKAVLEYFLIKNAEVHFGSTPLHEAAKNENPTYVKYFLNQGHDPNLESLYYGTPIHAAAYDGLVYADTLQTLIDAGAEINYKDSILGTPLHVAARRRDSEDTELLIKFGGDLTITHMNLTPLMDAYDVEEGKTIDEDYIRDFINLTYQYNRIEEVYYAGITFRIPHGYSYDTDYLSDGTPFIVIDGGYATDGYLLILILDNSVMAKGYEYAPFLAEQLNGSSAYECSLDQYCSDFYDSDYGDSTFMVIDIYGKLIEKRSYGNEFVFNAIMSNLP